MTEETKSALEKWKEEIAGLLLVLIGAGAWFSGAELGSPYVAPAIMAFGVVTIVGPSYYNGLRLKRDGVEFGGGDE